MSEFNLVKPLPPSPPPPNKRPRAETSTAVCRQQTTRRRGHLVHRGCRGRGPCGYRQRKPPFHWPQSLAHSPITSAGVITSRLGSRPRKFEMADAALAGGWLGSEAVAPVPGPERTGWAAEEEPAPLGKGFFQDEDSCSDCRNRDKPRAGLQSFVPEGATHFPEMFQTSHLLFYEPFRAYQGYIYVTDVGFAAFKAVVSVAAPYLCESQVSIWTLEHLKELLGLEEHQLPLQELWLVFDDSGVFDQTVLAIELVRHRDVLEDRVPSGLNC
ncbi:SHC SH2 domain-binding protein 1-like [Diceros bicornis minor]|uniref:SHC SH2 domain-binding protein 1-like n=1 Tax=Diceros bicornis minor TaxID=77932 RepID=UPI0026EC8D5F|nr:SHC SH2 domain-binding protein 1-like [Diceros bicornis minor]